jgi:RNA polymerase primary sigma factor
MTGCAGDEEDNKGGTAMTAEDGFQQFLSRVARHRILSGDEEKMIARRVHRGGVDGQRAREEMASHNMRLVIAVASKYRNRGLPFEDLVQEGALGLERAIDKFDPERGFKFSTYATWWIRQAVQRAVANRGRTIRVPVHLGDRRAKIRAYLSQNPDAGLQEVADALEMDPHHVELALDVAEVTASLDAPVGADGASSWVDLIHDEDSPDPQAELDVALEHQELRRHLAKLPDKERRVVELRFGFGDGVVRSLQEVATATGDPLHVVSQQQRSAIRRLRKEMVSA